MVEGGFSWDIFEIWEQELGFFFFFFPGSSFRSPAHCPLSIVDAQNFYDP